MAQFITPPTTCSRDEMAGFRSPTQTEKENLIPLALKKINYNRRWLSIWHFFIGILCIGMTTYDCFVLPEKSQPISVTIVEGVLTVVLLVAFVMLERGKTANKCLQQKICDGDFLVLDCKLWNTKFDGETIGIADVWIRSLQGEYCRDKFTTDEDAAKEWQDGLEPTFLLLRCSYLSRDVFWLLEKKNL